MDTPSIDVLLVRCRLTRPEGLDEAARRFCAQAAPGLRLQRVAWAQDAGWAYVYGWFAAPAAVEPAVLPRLVALWQALCPQAAETDVSRLQQVQDLPGHARAVAASRHYVVETDPETGWEEELGRWYAEEHMPGLAAAPGCVHARRFLNHDAGPSSHAAYELVTQDALGSPPWLAVRGTAWSSRVRPHFTNTRRTMMRIVG